MHWKRPGIWLAIASTLLVVAFVVWDSRSLSPGALSAVHTAARADLEDDCEACHGGGATSMADACSSCHDEIARQLVTGTGFHGTMRAEAARCGLCHSEHHGAEHALAAPHAFAQAGIADVAAFRHEGLGFELAGDHTTLACERCHEHARDAVLPAGAPRFLGESQTCTSCHADPHGGLLNECAACHGQSEPFATVAEFVHPPTFALTGRHAGVGCIDCHPRGSAFAIEASGIAGGTGRTTRAARSCSDCHASPHARDFVRAVAGVLALDLDATCANCHSPETGSFRGSTARMDGALHALTGFALAPPHAEAACEQCHASSSFRPAPAASDFHALHPGRRTDQCQACHVDPHGGQFASGAFAGANCTECHEATRFEPASFGVPDHARTAFPLSGAHEAVACAVCHAQPDPASPRRFHGTASDCASCHVDAHGGSFDRASVPAVQRGEAGCARCHDTSTFGAVKQSFDHALWTDFALGGAHARAACTTCHAPSAVADATGRTFGRVARTLTGSPNACATCHPDVHGGRFDARTPTGRAADETGCARCHDVESFHGARAEFAHGAWTGFALTGSHARAECEACHVARATPDANRRRFGLVSERFSGSADRCDSCHTDVHAGAFGTSACESCHSTETFHSVPKASFDHGRATGFALEGAHARAECAACHAPTQAGSTRTFGRARGGSCQDCHADPHVGQFTVSGRTDCARCHAPKESFQRPHFDHARDARFALDATHAALDCARCHVPTPLASGGTAVRYKPLGTVCADCHVPARR